MDKGMMAALDEFFAGYDESRQLFETLHRIMGEIGEVETRITRSQVAFVHAKPFAWVWMPGKYLRGKVAPLVLTLALRHRDPSPRWKKVVEPYPGRFTHHLELYSVDDIDEQVREWLHQAWSN